MVSESAVSISHQHSPRANLNITNPGGTISGPVYIPKVYDGRNKTFFLFGYNWVRRLHRTYWNDSD